MATTSPAPPTAPIHGKIIEAEVKLSVDPGRPLPLGCGLYAIETEEGVWLCAYYGSNRSVFEFLPQKGADFDERTSGIAFHAKEFVPKSEYQPARWADFKQTNLMIYKMEH